MPGLSKSRETWSENLAKVARLGLMTGEVWALLSVGVVLLGVLLGAVLPMIRALGDRIDKQGEYLGGRIDALGRDLRSELGGRIDALGGEIRALAERTAKLEFLPWSKKEEPKR